MSGPHVYTPHPSNYPLPEQVHTGNYNYAAFQPVGQPSPFQPDISLFPVSPYRSGGQLPRSAPGSPYRVRFSDQELLDDDMNWEGNWATPIRQRRPSFHGTASAGAVPNQTFLQPSAAYLANRRHSYQNTQAPQIYTQAPPDPWQMMNSPQPTPYNHLSGYPAAAYNEFRLHPALDGTKPLHNFLFNLNSPRFEPMRSVSAQTAYYLTANELLVPASMPPITRLKIHCDGLPWPIMLGFDANSAAERSMSGVPMPFSLGDILMGIYSQLRVNVSKSQWEALSHADEAAIGRAYHKRTSEVEGGMGRPGVLRLDYLKGKTWFRGLVRMGDAYDEMRMVVSFAT